MTKLLINEPPLQVLPTLACWVGLNEAIFLQQLHYWLTSKKVQRAKVDGVEWVRMTVGEWETDNFPFWSDKAIKRMRDNLKADGIIAVRNDLGQSRDQADWYTIKYDVLDKLKKPVKRQRGLRQKRKNARAAGQNVPVDKSGKSVDNLARGQNVLGGQNVLVGGTKCPDDTGGQNVLMYMEREESSSSSSSFLPQEEEDDRARKALAAAGIGRNMWAELMPLEWVTAESVIAHVAATKQRGEPINYAIQRLRQGDSVPESIAQHSCAEHGSGYWLNGECLVCSGTVKM
ncbi:MAG: hypothetical protein KDE47_23565 [Caldilineaceae bacterium]|nr:hypothetical protein [Caldilineaceae bacterium]